MYNFVGICIGVCMYKCIYAYTYTQIYIHIYIYMSTWVDVCVFYPCAVLFCLYMHRCEVAGKVSVCVNGNRVSKKDAD